VFVYSGSDNNETNMTVSNWTQVAANGQISGTNDEVMSFNAVSGDIYAYNGKTYIVASSDGNASGQLTAADVNISVAEDSTSDLTLVGELYSGDSQSLADTGAAVAIAEVGAEYVGSITSKMNARINASDSFESFYDQYADDNLEDELVFSLTQKATLAGASLGDTVADVVLVYDNNLTVNDNTATGMDARTSNDYNVTGTVSLTGSGTADTETIELALDGNDASIPVTTFTLNAYVSSGSNVFNVIPATAANAGTWTVYGYTAQIPNVSGLSTHETTMKFTNRSTLDTNIYFTLIDPDGTVVTLDSVTNTELAAIAANETGTYKASTLVSLITDPDFDATGSFSVEVSIPTTPTSVYGMASFKNTTLGQFKDLPVYNSSTMSY
jgi:hypothetical protein